MEKSSTKTESKNILFSLGFEVTRRCNMNCAFCARGKSQNVDMTKEIIDKTLDEIQKENAYINTIRLTGGETTLNPEAIEYIIDGIIKRNIIVRLICVFTNGLIKDDRIRNAYIRFVQYRHSIEEEVKIIKQEFITTPIYKDTNLEGVLVIISDYGHANNKDTIEKSLNFYRYEDNYFSITSQSNTIPIEQTHGLVISGNIIDNYKQFFNNEIELKNVRIINNHYNFMYRHYKNGKRKFLSTKTISISANGNVYVGCMTDYNTVDSEPMFNILDCNRDFIDRIINWCWQYPINEKTKNFREHYEALLWCKKHDIIIKDISSSTEELAEIIYKLTHAEEKLAKDLHQLCRNLDTGSLDALATAVFIMNMIEDNAPKEWVQAYLNQCSDFDTDTINTIIGNKETALNWLRGFILFLSEKDKKLGIERKKELAKTKNKHNK